MFVHLANDGSSVEANVDLQCKASRLAPESGVDEVIVPLSFATLQWPAPAAGDQSAFNFGFKTPLTDGYITGKLAAEQVWVDWQMEASARRRVAFFYIPAILGRCSAWTQDFADYRPDRPIWVPALAPLFVVDEARLADRIIALCRKSLAPGVMRTAVFDPPTPLAEVIRRDRGGGVRELACPGIIWRAARLSRVPCAACLMDKALRAANKATGLSARHHLLPVGPLYYASFEMQACAGGAIAAAAQ